MNNLRNAAIKLAAQIEEKKNEDGKSSSWYAPHQIWPFIDQMRMKGLSLETACWLVRNWLNAGWIPPSVLAEEQEKEIASMREEMASVKLTMNQLQDWYSKLDDFLKERAELKKE